MSDQVTDAPVEGQVDVPAANDKPWYDGADPDTVGFIQNKKWDTPLKAIEGYRNLEKYVGTSPDQLLKLPKPDDAAGWDAVFTKLGRPESPDKYGTDGVKPPEGQEIDSNFISKFDNIFHKTGLSKSQRDAIVNEYLSYEQSVRGEYENKIAQEKTLQEEALKKEWGSKYDERVELARRAFKQFLPEGVDKQQVAEALEGAIGVGLAAKLFANMADKFSEDTFHEDNGGSDRKFGYTKEQAINDRNNLMQELKADRSRLDNYNKGIGPDIEKMTRLNKLIAEG